VDLSRVVQQVGREEADQGVAAGAQDLVGRVEAQSDRELLCDKNRVIKEKRKK